MFDAILRARFKKGRGCHHIREDFFSVYYAHSPNTLLTKAGFTSLLPGKRIIMTMLFIGSVELQQCPRCYSQDLLRDEFNIRICPTCSLRFDAPRTTSASTDSRIDPIDYLLVPSPDPGEGKEISPLQSLAVVMGFRRSTTWLITDRESQNKPYDHLDSFWNIRIQTVETLHIQGKVPENTSANVLGRLGLQRSDESE